MSERGTMDEWDGDETQHWVTEADRDDGQLAPFGELLFTLGAEVPSRTPLASCYEPGRGVVLGTGAWLVSAARQR